ncbi:MAG: hypothetical protein QM749_10640 [Aquabacterium sp.]
MKHWRAQLRTWASQNDWADELDFAGPRVRTASWSWILLLAGLTAAIWLWPMVTQADADAAQARLDLKRLQRAAHQQALAAKAAQMAQAKGEGKTMDPSPEAMRHAAQLAQWLGYPWTQVLDQVEHAAQAEQAVMLSFSLDIGAVAAAPDAVPEVRLSAAVRDDESALRWAQTLGSSAQLRGREKLGTPFMAASGQYDWRVEAAWTGETP